MDIELPKEFRLTPLRRKAISALLEGIIVALTRLGYLEQNRANELIEKLHSDALNDGQLRLLTDIVVGWFSVCGYFSVEETNCLEGLLNRLWGYFDMCLPESREEEEKEEDRAC